MFYHFACPRLGFGCWPVRCTVSVCPIRHVGHVPGNVGIRVDPLSNRGSIRLIHLQYRKAKMRPCLVGIDGWCRNAPVHCARHLAILQLPLTAHTEVVLRACGVHDVIHGTQRIWSGHTCSTLYNGSWVRTAISARAAPTTVPHHRSCQRRA